MPLVLPGQEVSLSEPGRRFERHHHFGSYAALVVRGECCEFGDSGRFEAGPGNVLVHDSFEGHAALIGPRGAAFLNIQIERSPKCAFGRVADLDAVVRAFEKDPVEGRSMFYLHFRPRPPRIADWPDLLAADLASGRAIRLDQWADSRGIHPSSLSRGFRLCYGITPKRYRLERMTSRAARRLVAAGDNIAGVALECGFADQAHLTRSMVGLFGTTPSKLRRLS
ncbi:MAG: helix-turn-helix transcriptional regulator [Sphingomonas sp.]|nr:helix-turn-helix transcriptional regulator [Sphingomonas sp.]